MPDTTGQTTGVEDATPKAYVEKAMINDTGSWFYLSFADAGLPEGSQWLGCCYVRGSEGLYAICRAHYLGINPGGEVKFIGPIDQATMDELVPAGDWERLLSREDIEAHGPVKQWGNDA